MTKDKTTGKMEIPNLYDINGSANFYNKTDFGVTVYRDFTENVVNVFIQKIKFKHLGEVGNAQYVYNYINGRYEENGKDIHYFDNKPWIINENTEYQTMQPNMEFENDKEYKAPF